MLFGKFMVNLVTLFYMYMCADCALRGFPLADGGGAANARAESGRAKPDCQSRASQRDPLHYYIAKNFQLRRNLLLRLIWKL